MRTGGIIVGSILRGDPHSRSIGDVLHEIDTAAYLGLRQSYNIDVIFGVLPGEEYVLFIEQVVQLAAVDLVEGDPHLQVVSLLHYFENVLGGQYVQPSDTGSVSKHGVCLTAACLSIREAGNLRSIECTVH